MDTAVGKRQGNKVIAFDSWMQYAHIFERLVHSFAEKGFELSLIHIGSWGHDPARPTEEWLGRLCIRDISYYGGLTFKEILEREQPVAVLFLSLQPFAHRTVNRYCAQLGIPTVHLYHGIVRVQDTTSSRFCPINWRSHFARILTVVWKNVVRVWPAYLKALWDTKAPAREWWWFANVVCRQIMGTSYTGSAAPDARTSACCVYTRVDVEHAVQRYGVPPASVHAVGNPDLVRFGVTADDLGLKLKRPEASSSRVMYIDCALIDIGLVFAGPEEYAAHLDHTKRVLADEGFHMLVKLHPAHFRTGLRELLTASGIEVCENDAFLDRLRECCACIAEPSSLAVIPGLLGMPLFLAAFGKLRAQVYGEVLTSYPRARRLTDVSAFSALYNEVRADVSTDAVDQWISLNTGPLPAEDIPRRIAHVVASLQPKFS